MQFFCILFFKQFDSFEKQICCNFIISNVREGKVVNAQKSSLILLRFFPSDLPVVLMIPRFKKKVKKSQNGPAKKVNKCQTWINSIWLVARFVFIYAFIVEL